MDPLITNGVDPVLLGGMEKRGGEDRVPSPRRKRTALQAKAAEEENAIEPEFDTPPHTLDDLA